jgi:hypothetical protein
MLDETSDQFARQDVADAFGLRGDHTRGDHTDGGAGTWKLLLLPPLLLWKGREVHSPVEALGRAKHSLSSLLVVDGWTTEVSMSSRLLRDHQSVAPLTRGLSTRLRGIVVEGRQCCSGIA